MGVDADDAVLAGAERALADRAAVVLPQWLAGKMLGIVERAEMGADQMLVDAVTAAAAAAAAQAVDTIRQLAETDMDRQRTTPLQALRIAVAGVPTQVLQRAGVAPAVSDPDDKIRRSGDIYALAPGSWDEVDADLAGLALELGAIKAAVHRRRHLG